MKASRWLSAVAILMLLVLAGCDWWQTRFDTGRSGNNPLSGISTNNASTLRQAWSVPGRASAELNLLIAHGIVLGRGQGGGLLALNESDGSTRWTSTAAQGIGAVDRDTVYAETTAPDFSSYTLTALSLETGAVQWSATAAHCCGGLILAASNGKLYVTVQGHIDPATPPGLDVWDTATHHIVWSAVNLSGHGAGAVANDTVYYVGNNPQPTQPPSVLYAVDARTGQQHWSRPVVGSCGTNVVVSGGYVFVDGSTYRASDGAFVANWPTCIAGSPAVKGTTVFGLLPGAPFAGKDQLVSFDAVTGTMHWSYTIGTAEPTQAPAIGNDVVFVSNNLGVIGFDTTSGHPVALVGNVNGALYAPTIADGTIYAATTTAHVYAWRAS